MDAIETRILQSVIPGICQKVVEIFYGNQILLPTEIQPSELVIIQLLKISRLIDVF